MRSEPAPSRVPGIPPDPEAPVADAARDPDALRRARFRSGLLVATLLAVAIVLTASLLIDVDQPWFQPFDDSIRSWAVRNQHPLPVAVAKALDVIGSVWVTVPLRLLAIVVLTVRRRWTQLSVFVVAIVASELCIGPLKALVGRNRPPMAEVVVSAPSFPSGHAVAAAVTAFGLVIAFLPRSRWRLHWMVGASLLAASMALSRLYLSAHWATDTIAGVCLGTGIAVGTEVVAASARTRRAARRASSGMTSGSNSEGTAPQRSAP